MRKQIIVLAVGALLAQTGWTRDKSAAGSATDSIMSAWPAPSPSSSRARLGSRRTKPRRTQNRSSSA